MEAGSRHSQNADGPPDANHKEWELFSFSSDAYVFFSAFGLYF